jgi:tetratricopeptide (TPR) repeat protein
MIVLLLTAILASSDCDEEQPQLNRVNAAIEQSDFESAAKLLDSLEYLSFRCPNVMVAAGRVALGKGDYRGANMYSELALKNAPDSAGALLLRGRVLASAGQTAAARDLFEKASKLDPQSADAHFEFGRVLDAAKLTPQAVAEFEKAIQLRPRDPRAHDYLALNLERLGETGRAEAAYVAGLKVNEGARFDSLLDYNYGKFLLKLNRLSESKTHLDRAVELAPQVRAVHYDHAKLNLRLGKLAEARRDAETALSLPDPNGFILDLQIYNLLATVCTRLDDTASAQKYIDLVRQTPIPMRSRER